MSVYAWIGFVFVWVFLAAAIAVIAWMLRELYRSPP
jgi:hypothetical protein